MKELDVLLREHVTPVMRAEGFRKSGHTYRQTLPSGDSLIVGFYGIPVGTWCNFVVHVAFVPQPLLEMHNWSYGKRLDAPTQANWWGMHLPNHADSMPDWRYDTEAERERCAGELTIALPRAVRGLHLLANRDVLLDLVRAPVQPSCADLPAVGRLRGGAGGLRMALLVERGPSPDLQPFLDFYAGGPFAAHADWAAARLEAGRPLVESFVDVPQPRTMAGYEPLQGALDAALDRFVTPSMAVAGFDRIPGGYERLSPRGDRAGVDVRLSATATEDALAFTVVTGLRPAPSGFEPYPAHAESARLATVNPTDVTVSWLVSQLRPPPEFTSPVFELAELGLHPWSVSTNGLADGFGLLGRLLAEANAPFLASMLDRSRLLEFLRDPANSEYSSAWTPQIRAALLLLDDEARTAELADALDDVRQTVGMDHQKFLAWVASRGDGESHSAGS